MLIIAETTQQALLGDDFSIVNAFVLIVTLFAADISLAFLKGRSARLALWLDGAPTVLINGGKSDVEAFTRARVSVADVLEAARAQQGVASLDRIEAAILETSGGISIILKDN